MRKYICDICGKEIKPPFAGDYSFAKKEFLEANRRGLFTLEYHAPVVNEKDEVVHFSYPDTHICPDCNEIANEAIWKALDPVIKARKKRMPVKIDGVPYEPEKIVRATCGDDLPSQW